MPAKTKTKTKPKQKTKKNPSTTVSLARIPTGLSITPPTPEINSLSEEDLFMKLKKRDSKLMKLPSKSRELYHNLRRQAKKEMKQREKKQKEEEKKIREQELAKQREKEEEEEAERKRIADSEARAERKIREAELKSKQYTQKPKQQSPTSVLDSGVQTGTTKKKKEGKIISNEGFADALVSKLKTVEGLNQSSIKIVPSGSGQLGYYVKFEMPGAVNSEPHFHIFKEGTDQTKETDISWRLIVKVPIIVKTKDGEKVIDLRLLQNTDDPKTRTTDYNSNTLLIRHKSSKKGQTQLKSVNIDQNSSIVINNIIQSIKASFEVTDEPDLRAKLVNIFENEPFTLKNLWNSVTLWYFNKWASKTRGKLNGGKKTKKKSKSKKCGRNLFKMIKKTIRIR